MGQPECFDDEPKILGDNIKRKTVQMDYSIINEEGDECGTI